ncbi:MAG: MFS transporter [Dermatophilaceae bacterium]
MTQPTVTSVRAIAVPAYGPTILASMGTGAVTAVYALSAVDLGASVGVAAFVVALLGIGQLVGDLPAGALAARVGERRALLLACGAEALGMLGCALAPGVGWLAAAVLFVGLSNAVFGLARQAFLTGAVPIALRARALSTLGGVHRIGVFIGPFIGAWVVSRWGIQAAYGVGVVASGLAFALLLGYGDLPGADVGARTLDRGGSAPPRQSVRSVLAEQRRVLLTLGVGVVFVSGARAARNAVVPLWAQAVGLDATATSLVFGISGAVDMLLFYPAGWVMDRYGRALVAVPSMLVMGLAMVLLPGTHSFWTVTAAACLIGVGNGMGAGIVMTLGADVSPVSGRPQFLGGWRLMADLGWAGWPAMVSLVAAVAPLSAAVAAIGVVTLVGGGWLAVWVPRYDPISRRTVERARGPRD